MKLNAKNVTIGAIGITTVVLSTGAAIYILDAGICLAGSRCFTTNKPNSNSTCTTSSACTGYDSGQDHASDSNKCRCCLKKSDNKNGKSQAAEYRQYFGKEYSDFFGLD